MADWGPCTPLPLLVSSLEPPPLPLQLPDFFDRVPRDDSTQCTACDPTGASELHTRAATAHPLDAISAGGR